MADKEISPATNGQEAHSNPPTVPHGVTLHRSLAEAKLAVMAEVAYCKKVSAQGLSYTFASESELLAALRPAMLRHGLSVSPVGSKQVDSTQYQSKNGALQHKVRVVNSYAMSAVLLDGTVETQLLESMGEAADTSDKATPKANTSAFKYMLRQGFMIETGDDPDKYQLPEGRAIVNQEEKEREQAFYRWLGAIETAQRKDDLAKYRGIYLHRNNLTPDHKKSLEEANQKRARELDSKKS